MANFLRRFSQLLHDPPPDYVFELSEAGIAWARPAGPAGPGFQPLEPGVVEVSPLADNVHRADALADAIRGITGPGAARRGRSAVLILPDYCARVAVLAFDQFPADPKDQLSLVKFRMKKSVPFDVDAAAVSFHAPSGKSARGPVEVVVVVAALEIVSRYEAAFRASGIYPGYVTTAAIAMSELNHEAGVSILARLTGRLLTVVVLNGTTLKLVRTVELGSADPEEVMGVLFPTMAYIEDEMGTNPVRISMCGFVENGRAPDWVSQLQIPVEPLRSRFGEPNAWNAGLLGYLESVATGVKVA